MVAQSPSEAHLFLIETEQEIIVSWSDDPQDWVARFKKERDFPAHHWASRMQSLYAEQVQHSNWSTL